MHPQQKRPSDAVLIDCIRQGKSNIEISTQYGVSVRTIATYIAAGRLREAAEITPRIRDTAEKVVTYREILSKNYTPVRIAISLPRIPTLHGYFRGAV